MRLNQMRYFVTVCKYLNYTRAAEELYVSQPAISQAMRELESECGVPLLKRKGNNITLTEEGKLLCEEATHVLSSVSHLDHLIQDLHLQRNYVRIGISTISGNVVFPDLCRHFHQLHPEIEIISRENNTPTLFQLLENDEVDIILTTPTSEEEALKDRYNFIKTNPSSLVYCVTKDHPYAAKHSVTYEEISSAPIVVLSGNATPTRALIENLEAEGLTPNIIHSTTQMYTVERFIESGAAGFLPEDLVRKNPHLVALDYPWYRSDLSTMLLWKKERALYPSVQQFINASRRYLKEHGID